MIHATQDPLVQHVVLITQLCLTLCNAMDWIQLGSSVHGILQARILDWVASAFSIVQHIRFIHLAVIWVIRPCRSSDWLSLVSQCLCSSNLYLLNNGLKCKSSDVGNSNKPKRSCKVHPFSEKVKVFSWVNKGKKKKKIPGNSLVAQWLGLGALTTRAWSSIPGQGTKILQTTRWGQRKTNKRMNILSVKLWRREKKVC